MRRRSLETVGTQIHTASYRKPDDLRHLAPLRLSTTEAGVPATEGTRSIDHPRLQLLGYGDWTGTASATLIGAGRTARAAIDEVLVELRISSTPPRLAEEESAVHRPPAV